MRPGTRMSTLIMLGNWKIALLVLDREIGSFYRSAANFGTFREPNTSIVFKFLKNVFVSDLLGVLR